MSDTVIITHPDFEEVLGSYPEAVQNKLRYLRQLVRDTALGTRQVTALKETLKWGEPSFATEQGSTLRVRWKEATPRCYQMYIHCAASLVETFRIVFGGLFQYDKNRAIIFDINKDIPEQALKECIRAALRYHDVKGEMTLGL